MYSLYMEKESTSDAKQDNKVRLVDVPVTDESVSLNLLVSFLQLAQKRGAFTIDESAKIWECVQIFHPKKVES